MRATMFLRRCVPRFPSLVGPTPRRIARAARIPGAGLTALLGIILLTVVPHQPPGPAVHTLLAGGRPDALALDPRGDRAFVADDADAAVSVLDLASDRVLRTIVVGQSITDPPLTLALDAHTHHLFVANRGDNGGPSAVRLLDSRSGVVLATVRVGPEADALAVDERAGHVLVATQGDNRVSLLDARTGAVLRTTWVGVVPLALAVDARTARAFVVGANGTPLSYGGTSGWVRLLDTRTGSLVRTVAVGHEPDSIAVDARTGRAFVANSGDDTVSVLDARTGAVLRTVAVGLAPDALAVDARAGRVFAINEGDGTLSMLDARSGRLLRTLTIFLSTAASMATRPYALAVDEARERVYVTAWGQLDRFDLPLGSGQLAVLDARDGRPLRMLAVGVASEAVAVDARSGRVVVVSSGGLVRAPQSLAERWVRQMAGWVPWLGRILPRLPDVVRVPASVAVLDPTR